ncbi:MAG: hypothetical protein U9N81_12105 [Bacillota bacterium]|nr:hypothetical protein [Bacillota bacterium]
MKVLGVVNKVLRPIDDKLQRGVWQRYLVEILGEYSEDQLATQENYSEQYPDDGCFICSFMDKTFEVGQIGVWEIDVRARYSNYQLGNANYTNYHMQEFDELTENENTIHPTQTTRRFCLYEAKKHVGEPIYVIWQNGSIDDKKNVRKKLTQGIVDIEFEPAQIVLLGFRDSKATLKLTKEDFEGTFIKLKDSRLYPKGVDCFSLTEGQCINIEIIDKKFCFAPFYEMPKSNISRREYPSQDDEIRKTLNDIRDWFKNNNEANEQLTRSGKKAIAEFVQMFTNNNDLLKRAQNLITLVDNGLTLDEELYDLTNRLLDTYPFSKIKEEAIETAVRDLWLDKMHQLDIEEKEYQKRLFVIENKRNEIAVEIEKLESSKQYIIDEIKSIKDQNQQINSQFEENIREAIHDVPKLLSQVALLRPLLQNSEASSEMEAKTPKWIIEAPRKLDFEIKQNDLNNVYDFVKSLKYNMSSMGIDVENAKSAALWITAICLAGIIPVLTSSSARQVASAVAITNYATTHTLLSVTDYSVNYLDISSAISNNKLSKTILIEGIEQFHCETIILPILRKRALDKFFETIDDDILIKKETGLFLHFDPQNQPCLIPETMWDYCIAADIDPYLSTSRDYKHNFRQIAGENVTLQIDDIHRNRATDLVVELIEKLANQNIHFSRQHLMNLEKVLSVLFAINDKTSDDLAMAMLIKFHIACISKNTGREVDVSTLAKEFNIDLYRLK